MAKKKKKHPNLKLSYFQSKVNLLQSYNYTKEKQNAITRVNLAFV